MINADAVAVARRQKSHRFKWLILRRGQRVWGLVMQAMEPATAPAAGNKPTPWPRTGYGKVWSGRGGGGEQQKRGSYRVTYQNAANGQVKQIRCEGKKLYEMKSYKKVPKKGQTCDVV